MILAEIATQIGNAEMAIQQYEQVLPYSRKPAQVHYRISSLYAVQKNPEQSIRHLEQARQLAPEDYNILLSLAGMIETQGRLAEAQTLYRKILAAEPENAVALNNLAFNLAESGGNLDEALRLAERAVKHVSGQANFVDTLGWIYLKKKDVEPALQIMGNLAQRYPENSTFRYHHALALLEKGDKVKAKQELQAALSAQPTATEENRIRLIIAQLD
jgi:tetratricopeptide (TPR) repeat protein